MGNGNSKRRGPGKSSGSSKLSTRIIAPTFGRKHSTAVNYTQQRNQHHRTPPPPTRTPTRRRHDRVIPAPETINQQRFHNGIRSEDNSTTYDDLSYEEEYQQSRQRVNLYGCTRDSYEDFDQLPTATTTARTTNGLDKSRNWISTSSRDSDKNRTEFIDQWPCEIVDTDHPVIFVESRVYVGPNDKDEFKCYDLGPRQEDKQLWEEPLPPYSHSTPKQQQAGKKKKVLFEKVNYEKYRRGRSERTYSGDDEDSPGGRQRLNECSSSSHNHYFSNGEIDRDEYGHKWCQDLLNWSREAAQYQRRHHNHQPESQLSPEFDGSSCHNNNSNWFQDRFRSSSASRYNKMSGTEDSGVVCQFEDDEADEQAKVDNDDEDDDDDFWSRSNNFANDKEDRSRLNERQWANEEPAGKGAAVDDGDSWEALKQRVFLPAENRLGTPSKLVLDSEGRLLGRRCSCNSMCTSLCTVETWLDDDVFDNTFNEELERRCGISTN